MIVFDIETGPRPLDELLPLMPPFDDTVEEFDESKVRLGNLKDGEKIKAKLAEARAAHEAIVAGMADRKAAHQKEFVERAALSARTGMVLAIGERTCDEPILVGSDGGSEAETISRFWDGVDASIRDGDSLVGFNIFGFDLPFLIRRSYLLRIDVPKIRKQGRWHPIFIDLLDVWRCGDRSHYIKLDELARILGIEGKPDGVTGADFAGLWESDRPRAIAYLTNDLRMTWQVAEAMQVL